MNISLIAFYFFRDMCLGSHYSYADEYPSCCFYSYEYATCHYFYSDICF